MIKEPTGSDDPDSFQINLDRLLLLAYRKLDEGYNNHYKISLQVAAHVCQPHTNNQLTPWSRILPEKLTGTQLIKKFPAFYGTRKFTSRTSILILSSHT